MTGLAYSGPHAMSQPWVSVDEEPDHLGVAKDTVYHQREIHGVPAHGVGTFWKLKLLEVVERGVRNDRRVNSPKQGET